MHNSERLIKPPVLHIANESQRCRREQYHCGPADAGLFAHRRLEIPVEVSDEAHARRTQHSPRLGSRSFGNSNGSSRTTRRVSINDLTDDPPTDALCDTAAFNGTWVSVKKLLTNYTGER